MINPRASELIKLLDLEPHPEGGYFSEIFRSSSLVKIPNGSIERRAMTEIYFLLTLDDYSCWHRVSRDEVWHYYEGAALELFWLEEKKKKYNRCLVCKIGETSRPVAVVPAGCWQAARTTGEYTLVGCTMAPGFEFKDFQLLRDLPKEEQEISARFPELAILV